MIIHGIMNDIHAFNFHMRKIPNFVLLRAFEAASRLESFTLAAKELHLTQSAISHQIKELEDYFGKPLFIRRNRQVETNLEGRRLRESLSRVFDVLEAACNEVNLAPSSEVLTLYCSPSFAAKWLSPRLPEFLDLYPDIAIRLTSGADSIDLIRNREIDLAISYQHTNERPGIVSLSLGDEKIIPMCAPHLIKTGITLEDMMRTFPLIESSISHFTWNDWFELNHLKNNSPKKIAFDRAALSISAAVEGLGAVLESTRFAERELSRGELVEIGKGVLKQFSSKTHFMSYRAGERGSKKISAFKEWMLQVSNM